MVACLGQRDLDTPTSGEGEAVREDSHSTSGGEAEDGGDASPPVHGEQSCIASEAKVEVGARGSTERQPGMADRGLGREAVRPDGPLGRSLHLEGVDCLVSGAGRRGVVGVADADRGDVVVLLFGGATCDTAESRDECHGQHV